MEHSQISSGMKDLSNTRSTVKPHGGQARRQRDGGYLLLAIMLMMALMVIAATVAAPRYVQQIKRDREEEMIHRGTQYARAIKKFYKKNGRYPASLDDLDKGQIKYLRQRYKDPLTKDGKWKLLNYGDIQTLINASAPGTPAAAMGTLGGNGAPGSSPFSNSASSTGFSQSSLQSQQLQLQQQPGGITGGFPSNSDQGGTNSEGSSNNFGGSATGSSQGSSFGSNSGQSGTSASNQAGGMNGNQPGGSSTSGPNNGQTFGGGAIVGVASLSKDPTIRIYNKKKTYDEWQFIYNPMMDQQNVLLKGPYQPTTIGGAQIGTPASQMNGQQQNQSPFGQQNSGFGQQNSGFGQQNGVGPQNSPQASPSPQ
jgi:type II secretory pathway pseudopilin PulG